MKSAVLPTVSGYRKASATPSCLPIGSWMSLRRISISMSTWRTTSYSSRRRSF